MPKAASLSIKTVGSAVVRLFAMYRLAEPLGAVRVAFDGGVGRASAFRTAHDAAADPIVVTLDDLRGDNLDVPAGYGGLDWLNGWTHYGFSQPPYVPHSGSQRIYPTGLAASGRRARRRVSSKDDQDSPV